MYPKEQIKNMVDYLKTEFKMSIHKIEKELSFSNGLIGKAIKGTSQLSDSKISALGKLYFDKQVEKNGTMGYIKILADGTVEIGEIKDKSEGNVEIPITEPPKEQVNPTSLDKMKKLLEEQKLKFKQKQ